MSSSAAPTGAFQQNRRQGANPSTPPQVSNQPDLQRDWIDLSAYGIDLIMVTLPSGAVYAAIRNSAGAGPGKGVEANRRSLDSIGFRDAHGQGNLYVRQLVDRAHHRSGVRPSARPFALPSITEWQMHFPEAVVVPFDKARHFVETRGPARQQPVTTYSAAIAKTREAFVTTAYELDRPEGAESPGAQSPEAIRKAAVTAVAGVVGGLSTAQLLAVVASKPDLLSIEIHEAGTARDGDMALRMALSFSLRSDLEPAEPENDAENAPAP